MVKRVIKKTLDFTLKTVLSELMYEKLLASYASNNILKKDIFKKNKTLKDAGRNKRAFLLATGPSINQENLSVLQDEDCFSVSNFFLHKNINIIKPKFHFFAPYHHPLIFDDYLRWMELAHEKLPKQTKIFLNYQSHKIIQKYNLFYGREIFYLYTYGSIYPKDHVDLFKAAMPPQTIPLMVLPVLIYMGYKEIYLLGCDHTTMRDHGRDFGKATNFYDPKKDVRKYHSYHSTDLDIIKVLNCVTTLFKQYDFYKKMCEKENFPKIVNLSQDSWLDIFPFKRLDEVIHEV